MWICQYPTKTKQRKGYHVQHVQLQFDSSHIKQSNHTGEDNKKIKLQISTSSTFSFIPTCNPGAIVHRTTNLSLIYRGTWQSLGWKTTASMYICRRKMLQLCSIPFHGIESHCGLHQWVESTNVHQTMRHIEPTLCIIYIIPNIRGTRNLEERRPCWEKPWQK